MNRARSNNPNVVNRSDDGVVVEARFGQPQESAPPKSIEELTALLLEEGVESVELSEYLEGESPERSLPADVYGFSGSE